MTPRQKAIRTALQTAGGIIALAVPLIAGVGLTGHQLAIATALIAFAGGVVALVQNVLEANGILPVLFGGAAMPPASPDVDVDDFDRALVRSLAKIDRRGRAK